MKNIYQHTDCLTDETIISYQKDELSQKERNRVENHLLDCEMCQDVLNGAAEMKNIDELPIIIETLNDKINEKTTNRRKLIGFRQLKYIGLAASIVILVGLSIFLGRELKNSQNMAMSENVEFSKLDFENKKSYDKTAPSELNKEEEIVTDTNLEQVKELIDSKGISDVVEIIEDDLNSESDIVFDNENIDEEDFDEDINEENLNKNTEEETLERTTENQNKRKMRTEDVNFGTVTEAEIVTGDVALDHVVVMEESMPTIVEDENISHKEKGNNLWNGKNVWTKNKTKKADTQATIINDFTNSSTLVYTARNYQEVGDYSNSMVYYDKILEDKNDPYYYEAKYNKAKILIEENKNDEALVILKELSKEKNNYQDSAKVLIKKIKK